MFHCKDCFSIKTVKKNLTDLKCVEDGLLSLLPKEDLIGVELVDQSVDGC